MAKLPLHVEIIFLIIVGCISPRCMGIRWTPLLGERLLDIFYGTYPDDERHLERVKREWDSQVANYKQVGVAELAARIHDFQDRYWKQWKERPPNEREWLEKNLRRIYGAVEKYPKDQEKKMLDIFLEHFPQYVGEARMIRTIVYRWHKLYIPLGKEIPAKYVDWTPQREAFLENAFDQLENNIGGKKRMLRELWLTEYRHLNVDEESLSKHAYYIKERNKRGSEKRELRQRMRGNGSQFASEEGAMQEEGCGSKGRKSKWSPQMKADILCIIDKLHALNVTSAAALKDRWDRMQTDHMYLRDKSLLDRASQLKIYGYKPLPELYLNAEERYAKLPPLPKEAFTERRGRRRSQPLQIPGGHQPSQQYQEEPASPSFELTPELLAHFQREMMEVNASDAGHAHYPHQTEYYGSTSHTPIDQGHSTSLPDTPHPHQQFWNPVDSSSYTSIHHDPFGSLSEIPHPHQDIWNAGSSSSHTAIQPDPFGSLSHTPYPHEDFWNPVDSSSHTPIQPDPFGSLPHTIHPHPYSWSSSSSSSHTPIHQDPFHSLPEIQDTHEHFSSPGGSRSCTSIHEDQSGLIAVASHPRRHQQDHRGGSSHTSIHENLSGLMVVAPRPHRQRDHRGSSNRTSVHQDSSRTHVDTPRPYHHQWFPGSGSRH